jgi:Cysteine rich repeat
MAHRIAWSFLIMATLFGVPTAFAQSGSSASPQQPVKLAAAQPQDEAVAQFYAACGQDVRRFCTGVQPGGGRVLQCFQAHRDELSTSCKLLFIEMGQRAAEKNTPSTRPDMPQAASPPGDQYGAPSGGRMTGVAY